MDFTSYIDWLNSVIDNYLTNQFLVIDEKFFTIEIGFLSYMIIYLSRFEKFTIKVKFLDENYVNIFMDVFTKTIYQNSKIDFKKLSFLKVLKFVNNDLTDDLFKEYLLNIFEITPALTELEISKNYISGDSLSELSFYFRSSLRYIEKLNFSNNWIDSFGLEDFIDKSLNNLQKLVYINLSQNFLDNDFLKHFDLYLRKNKSERSQDILIDLTKNRFDSHLLRFKFFKWKPEEEIERNDKTYSVFHFVENLTKMKAKLKIKLDLVKHHREKESDVTKKVLENIKSYTIRAKTTNEGMAENSVSLNLFKELDEMLTEIDQYFDPSATKSKLLASDTMVDKSKDSSLSDIFNPSNNIEDFNSIFKKIKNFKMNITYIQIHKFINKLKIIAYQSIRDKNIYDMNFLNKISEYFKTSNMEKLHTEYLKLQTRSKIIMEALIAILNFEGNLIEKNKNYFNEMNNFLDLFLHEADNINLKNDLVLIAKYIQFIRNNKLRGKFFSIFENILKEESLMNSNDRAAEFDMIYKKYKDISDYKVLRIPEEIKVKILSLHPNKLDYLIVCESIKDELDFDLALVSKNLKDDESYGLRNIHDRIHFLFSYSRFMNKSSDRNLDPNSKFYLNKNNNFLKISRVIFRYFNNLDFNLIFKDSHYFEYVNVVKGTTKNDFNNVDKDSIVNFGKIRIPEDILNSGGDFFEAKKKILTFSNDLIKESLIHCEEGKEKEFNELAIAINTKLLRIFEQEFDDQHPMKIKKSLKEFLSFFIHVKEHYKSDTQFVDDLNQEVVLQIYKLLNRNDFKEESLKIKQIFGFFNVLSYHLDLSPAFLNAFKRWINYLVKNNFYSDYCREIINNLINHNSGLIFWVPSTLEIEAKLDLKQIHINISLTSEIEETYIVSETTTISELYNDIINNSSNLSDIIEKKFYWIYLKISDNEDYIPLYSEEYVLDIMSSFEEGFIERGCLNSRELLKFCFRRRIFSKYILERDLNNLIDIELQILFEQVKENYLNKIFSSIISDSDSIELSSILLEFLRRKNRIKDNNNFNSKEFVNFLNNNLEKIVPKYKKETFFNDQSIFLEKIKQTYKELSLSDKNERMMEIEFLKIIRSYEFFFSSIYRLKSKKNNNYFVLPENFYILISVNGLLIIDEIKFEILYKFQFQDLIYTFFNSSEPNTLFLSINYNKIEKRFKFLTEEARIITEDILSYCQLSLFTNPSKLITVKKLELSKRNESVPLFFNLLDYNFVYQRKLACLKVVPNYTDLKKNRSCSVKLNKILDISCHKNIDIHAEIEKEKKYEKNLAKNRQSSNINDSSLISQDNKKISDNLELGTKKVNSDAELRTDNKDSANGNKNSRNMKKEDPSFNENFTTNPSRLNTIENNTLATLERKGPDVKEKEKDDLNKINEKSLRDNLKHDNDNKNVSKKETSDINSVNKKSTEEENKKKANMKETIETPSKKLKNTEEEINPKNTSQRKSILNSLISMNNQKKENPENSKESKKNNIPSVPQEISKSPINHSKPGKNEKPQDLSPNNTKLGNNSTGHKQQNNNDHSIKDISDLDLNQNKNIKPDSNNGNEKTFLSKPEVGRRISRNVNQASDFNSKTNDTPSSNKNKDLTDMNKKTIDNQTPKTRQFENKNQTVHGKDKDDSKRDIENELTNKKMDNSIPNFDGMHKKNKENDLPSFGNMNNSNKPNMAPRMSINQKNNDSNSKMPMNILNNINNINSSKPGTNPNNSLMNNFNSNLVKSNNSGEKPKESFGNSYNTNVTPSVNEKKVNEEEKKENVTPGKRDSIVKDQPNRRKSIQMTKRASQLLSGLNLGENKTSTINTDKSPDEKVNTVKENEKSPLNNKQAAQANIKKALNLIPNKGLFTKMTNAKGIDPTSKINI